MERSPAAAQLRQFVVDELSYGDDECNRASDHTNGEQHAQDSEENTNEYMHIRDATTRNVRMAGD